jgi:hypothetical protein
VTPPQSKAPPVKISTEPEVVGGQTIRPSHPLATREEEIDEFFGQARKSSQKLQFCADSDDEETDLGVHSDSEGSEGAAGHVTHSDGGGIDLQYIMENRNR